MDSQSCRISAKGKKETADDWSIKSYSKLKFCFDFDVRRLDDGSIQLQQRLAIYPADVGSYTLVQTVHSELGELFTVCVLNLHPVWIFKIFMTIFFFCYFVLFFLFIKISQIFWPVPLVWFSVFFLLNLSPSLLLTVAFSCCRSFVNSWMHSYWRWPSKF